MKFKKVNWITREMFTKIPEMHNPSESFRTAPAVEAPDKLEGFAKSDKYARSKERKR